MFTFMLLLQGLPEPESLPEVEEQTGSEAGELSKRSQEELCIAKEAILSLRCR